MEDINLAIHLIALKTFELLKQLNELQDLYPPEIN